MYWWLTLSLHAFASTPVVEVETTAPLVIDGVLDEEGWTRALPITDFQQFMPTQGGDAPGTTEIRLLQDEKHLYIGARVLNSPFPIRARLSQREAINKDDQIGVLLDTFGDQRTGYIFFFNPLGIQQDLRYNNGEWNFYWNAVMTSEGQATKDGYELEIAIPFRSLKYPKSDAPQDWGLILQRVTPQIGTKYGYPKLDRGHPQLFGQAATLSGITPEKRGSGFEILPSFTSIQTWEREETTQALSWGGLSPWHKSMRPSLDTRIGLSPTVGLTATINPDFSQVEGDVTPIAINQRFAFYFPERRPFFLDGAEYFSRGITSQFRRQTSTIPSFTRSLNTLYSRSIVEPIGGLKITGRTEKWSVGALNAIDQSPASTVNEVFTPGFSEEDVENKFASNSVLRLKRDVGTDGHVALTIADKHLFDSEETAGYSSIIGADSRLSLGNSWIAQGSSSHSTTGNELQQILGSETYLQLRRSVGAGTGTDLTFLDRTPNFRKETGFLNQAGHTTGYASVDHAIEMDGLVNRYRTALTLLAFQERNGEFRRSVETQNTLTIDGIHTLQAAAALNSHREGEASLNGWAAASSYRAYLSKALRLDTELSLERLLDYERLEPAMVSGGEIELNLFPLPNMALKTRVELQHLKTESDIEEMATLLRSVLQYQLTKEWGLRVIVEHSDTSTDSASIVTSILGTWMRHPGTALWFGYVESAEVAADIKALNRSVFVKGSILFRP